MKIKKTLIGISLCAFLLAESVVSANTVYRTVGNDNITAYSTITSNGANAGTTGTNASSTVVVSSTYSYVNIYSLSTGTTSKNSGNRVMAAAVSFSAPTNCKSVKISSGHTAKNSGETWSGTTSAVY